MEDNKFLPTDAWPLQETYKRSLHEYVQKWGERIAPSLVDLPHEERIEKEPFFEWLVECVPRGDALTAETIKSLDLQARETIGYSYYRETYSHVADDHPMLIGSSRRQFNALFAIYQAGKSA